jgi:hypothetical protein
MFRRTIWVLVLNILTAFLTELYPQYPSLVNQKKISDQKAEELIDFSENLLGKDFRLVNGRIYAQPFIKAYGQPFLKDIHWITGSVNVNGNTFTGLQLNYDIFNDQLIYLDESYDGSRRIILLNKNQVVAFSLGNQIFIKLEPRDISNISESQYFEFLFGGTVSLFKKWTKEYESNVSQDYPNGKFLDTKTALYILKNNKLYRIKNRMALLKVCEDEKEEMKKYFRKNRLNVRKGPDQKLIGFMEYYNQLISE